MAATNTEESVGRVGPPAAIVLRRLSESRWLIVAMSLVVVALTIADVVPLVGGLVVVAALLAGVMIVPRAPAERVATAGQPAMQVWPETGTKLFAEALPNPCFILDRRGIVRYANRSAIAAFSIRTGEQLTFRLRVPDLLAAFDRVAKGGSAERIEFAERVPTERWFAAWFAPLNAGGATGDLIALVIDDLSERRRSEKIRVDFVANASHELRTPLASLVGFIETLQGPARDDAEARERFLKIMRDQATRMSRLVDDLLSLSRIEMKIHVPPSGEVDLSATVQHVVDSLEPLARDLGVRIEADRPAEAAMLTGDRDELTQVFENLIENACKYGQSGGRVEVTLKPATRINGPSVSIRDFGQGIAEEHLPRLTERFYRIDVEASRRHRGTGLGLAIVKHILARHRARLLIDSKLGEGSVFTVVFPQGMAEAGSSPREKWS